MQGIGSEEIVTWHQLWTLLGKLDGHERWRAGFERGGRVNKRAAGGFGG